MNLDRQLAKFIRRLRLWIFVRRLLHTLLWCFPAGVFLGAVFEGISYFVPWYSVHYWAAGAAVASVLAALIWSVCRYPSSHEAALILDRTGLQERTVTALEMVGDENFFAVLQKNDAWEQLSRISVHKRLPVSVTWKRPVLLGTVCILFAASCLLPSPAKTRAKDIHQVVEQAKEEIEKIEKVQDELKEEEISSKELEEYDALMQDIRKELKEANTQEALEKALERAERKLTQAVEKTENSSLKDKMKQLSLALNKDGSDGDKKDGSQEGSSQAQASADLKKAEELKKAAEEAEELLKKLQETENLDELSEEELKAAKEALENLAELAENQDLAQSLQDAAAQISSGSLSSGALASAQASVSALKQAAGSALASGDGQPHFSKNGQSGEGSENNSGSGNGNGSGSGNGSGTGSGSGSGTGRGSGSGTGWNYGSKNGKEKDISYNGEMVSIPNDVGDDENLTGRNNEGTSYVTEGGDSLTWSGNSVEYGQVIGEYSKQALSDIESSDYPAGVQDIVKAYFEQLNQ